MQGPEGCEVPGEPNGCPANTGKPGWSPASHVGRVVYRMVGRGSDTSRAPGRFHLGQIIGEGLDRSSGTQNPGPTPGRILLRGRIRGTPLRLPKPGGAIFGSPFLKGNLRLGNCPMGQRGRGGFANKHDGKPVASETKSTSPRLIHLTQTNSQFID